jgi:hypothetical protein
MLSGVLVLVVATITMALMLAWWLAWAPSGWRDVPPWAPDRPLAGPPSRRLPVRMAKFERTRRRELRFLSNPCYGDTAVKGGAVMGLILGLLVLWLVLVIIGFTIKALLWLAIVGLVLFVVTGVFGAIRGRSRRGVTR